LVDFFSGMVGPAFTHEDAVAAFDLSSDGRMLAAASAGTTSTGEFQPAVYVWNAVSGGLLTTLPQEQPVTALAFSPDGRLLAVASGNEIVLWEPASQQPLKMLSGHTDLISVLRFSPNGTLLASASADQTVRFWQVQAP
jgi:WD40 repeat protein